MFEECRERGIFKATEQRVCDQARATEQRMCDQTRAIRQNGWLLEPELEAIKRQVEDKSKANLVESNM